MKATEGHGKKNCPELFPKGSRGSGRFLKMRRKNSEAFLYLTAGLLLCPYSASGKLRSADVCSLLAKADEAILGLVKEVRQSPSGEKTWEIEISVTSVIPASRPAKAEILLSYSSKTGGRDSYIPERSHTEKTVFLLADCNPATKKKCLADPRAIYEVRDGVLVAPYGGSQNTSQDRSVLISLLRDLIGGTNQHTISGLSQYCERSK